MELYDKKFLIYGNYMIISFGQPGILLDNVLYKLIMTMFCIISFRFFDAV